MFKKLLIPALIVASISSVAMAQDRGHDDNRGDNRGDHMQRGNDNHDNHGNDNRGNDNRGNDNRGGDRGHDNHGGPGPMAQDRGAGPNHDFRRGGRLPQNYRSNQYVVNDWRGHHLNAPPRGYHWVQTGNDYVLAAVATGVIASILLNQ